MATLSPGVESEQLAQQCVQHAGTFYDQKLNSGTDSWIFALRIRP